MLLLCQVQQISPFIDSLVQLAPCFGPYQLCKMVTCVHTRHGPETAARFNDGNFTIHKTRRVFSSMATDQAHEQNNAGVKSDGGAIGLTKNPEALRRWMVAGPEIVRITSEFEASMEKFHQRTSKTKHHDQMKSMHPGDVRSTCKKSS